MEEGFGPPLLLEALVVDRMVMMRRFRYFEREELSS